MVLIPTSDEWALAVARLPAEVAARFPWSQASLDSLDALTDKGRFASVLEERDERDGEFRLLEVNARPWYFIGFAALCGVDFEAMPYRDALGLPVEPVSAYPAGSHCIVGADRFACQALRRRDGLSAGTWLRSWLGARQLLFVWDDPVPAFSRILAHVWSTGIRRATNPRQNPAPLREIEAPRDTVGPGHDSGQWASAAQLRPYRDREREGRARSDPSSPRSGRHPVAGDSLEEPDPNEATMVSAGSLVDKQSAGP